jgi:hypothetical protein
MTAMIRAGPVGSAEIDHRDDLLFLDRAAGARAIHPRTTYL